MHRISADERSFLDAIHCDPQDDRPFHAYADWLTDRKEPLGEFIRVSCVDTKIGKPSKGGKKLVKRHGDEWLKQLPENSHFEGYFVKGLPRVRLELHARTPASPYEVMNAWWKGVSPRHMLYLCVDLRPSRLWEGTRKKCWVELDRVFRHPIMRQVYALSIAFGKSLNDATALSMASRRDVIREIAVAVNPTRTPFVTFYEASILTRRTAERELIGFRALRFAN